MKFSKVSDPGSVDFIMPPDHPQTAEVLMSHLQGQGRQPQVYLGMTGWSNPEWVGKWYPPKCKADDFLAHYSRQFGTIELNTTHYRVPDEELIKRWHQGAAPGFQFCPKVPQQISHRARLKAERVTQEFCAAVTGLKEKLGPVFLQLPEHHGPNEAALVLAYAREWPRHLPLHWEFRHPDWFNGHPAAEAVFDELAVLGQGHVVTDVSGRRDVLHMRLTNPVLVLRFVGNALIPGDQKRLADWVTRLRTWFEEGLHAAYIFIHQPEKKEAPETAILWMNALKEALKIDILGPTPMKPPPPAQQSLF